MFKRIQDWLKNSEHDAQGSTSNPSSDAALAELDTVVPGLSETQRAALTHLNIQNRFQPIRELGRGGTSSVHDAADLSLERHTALKVLHAELAAKPVARTQFIVEAQVTAQLEHPNIIPVYEFGQDGDGVPYINMRKVAGETFDRYVQSDATERLDPANIREAVSVLLRVCDALGYAHSRGVVHRDLKPANIMVGAFGEVYLMDWGIAITSSSPGIDPIHINADAATYDEARSSLAGTPAYMAPEQLSEDTDAVTASTDVFLMGATLYQLLTGVPPYAHAGNLRAIIELVAACDIRPIDSLTGARRAPPGLARIVEAAMRPNPASRFASIGELKQALEAFLHGTGHLGVMRFAPGETIVQEGEPGDRAYIIASGNCQVYTQASGQREVLREIGPGDVFGEMAILTGGVRTSSVDAATDVEVEVVTRESLTDSLGIKTWAGRFVTALAERFIELEQSSRASTRP